jgi:hypothetical protein
MSSESEPVGMPSALARAVPSSFMTEPLPNCFSICWTARLSAESRAGSLGASFITGFAGAGAALAAPDPTDAPLAPAP